MGTQSPTARKEALLQNSIWNLESNAEISPAEKGAALAKRGVPSRASCPPCSCLSGQEKSCAATKRSETEVPEPLPAPLVEEALGVGGAEEAAAHSCPSIGGESSCQVMWWLEKESKKHMVCVRKRKTNCPTVPWSWEEKAEAVTLISFGMGSHFQPAFILLSDSF